MKTTQQKCDILMENLVHGRCCRICKQRFDVKPATTMLRIFPQDHVRYWLPNTIPVCKECLDLIMGKKVDVVDFLPISTTHLDYVSKFATRDFGKILLSMGGITKEDYFKSQLKELKEHLL